MTIPALPAAPSPTDTPSEFNTKAFAFLAALDPWGDAADALAVTMDGYADAAIAAAASADTDAGTATTQAGIATTKAGEAAASAITAGNAATSAAASFDSFDDRYLGAKTSDPSLDNDGNALLTGALYFNSSVDEMRVRTAGGTWAAAYIPAEGYLTTGDIGSTVQAYDTDLTAWAGKTAPSGTAVGTSDPQTLTNKTIEAGTLTNGYTEEVYALGTSGSLALNPANGSIQTCALTGNPTFTDSLAAGQSVVVMLTNGSSYTVTFPTMTWVGPTGNVAPTLNSANVLVFWKVSSTLYGAHVGKYA